MKYVCACVSRHSVLAADTFGSQYATKLGDTAALKDDCKRLIDAVMPHHTTMADVLLGLPLSCRPLQTTRFSPVKGECFSLVPIHICLHFVLAHARRIGACTDAHYYRACACRVCETLAAAWQSLPSRKYLMCRLAPFRAIGTLFGRTGRPTHFVPNHFGHKGGGQAIL